MTTLYPTKLKVDLAAIRHNYREIRKIVPREQKVLCVVKSDAYGHGLEEVTAALSEEGADFFGVRDIDEGMALRGIGIKEPILLLLGLIDEAFAELTHFNLTPVIYNLEAAKTFNSYLKKNEQNHPIHIKVDTGMTRLGVPAEKVTSFMNQMKELNNLRVEGILSHLADAVNTEYTAKQKEVWTQIMGEIKRKGWDIPLWHLSNSIGAIQTLCPHDNMVRAGIILYGAYPHPSLQSEIDLRPALNWTTEIIDIKTVPAGTSVSYDCIFTTKRESLIALLPIGYADGYPRLISNRGDVLVHGKRAPIAGRVCMDLTMVDVTDIPESKIGDTVTLIGRDGQKQILAEEMAGWAETISYEILARIAKRIPRSYHSGG